MNKDCEKLIKFNHNEKPFLVNAETGEMKEIAVGETKRVMRDKSMQYFVSNQPYQRFFNNAWHLLRSQTTDLEYNVARQLGERAKAYTNSLEPLTPESTLVELSKELGVDRRKIEFVIDRLFKLGVIGKFEVYDRFETHHNFWIFNPYLCFNGKGIKKDVATLFDNTYYAML